MLEDSVERIHHASSFADIPRGVFLIRGENVVLLGEIVSILAAPSFLTPSLSPQSIIYLHFSHSSALAITLSPCLMFDGVTQDLDAEDVVPITPAPLDLMMDLNRQEVDDRKRRDNIKSTILYEQRGFCKEGGEGDGY